MPSVGIRCGGNSSLNCRFLETNNPNQNARVRPCNVKISNANNLVDVSRHKQGRMISMAMDMKAQREMVKTADSTGANEKAVVYEKVEEWMRDSVGEIVKNLREAPLLVHVYSEGSGETTTLRTEKAVAEENWAVVRERWEKKETQMPEGVIFVEKLEDSKDDDDEKESEEEITRAWGIVVQGKGVDCAPVCYLLKTSRVGPGSGSGLGLGCTHFCLVRVKSFRETTRSQLKNCWLVQQGP